MSNTRTSFFSWLMFPVYVWQGISLRMRIERLLPPIVPQAGKIGTGKAGYKILVLGDSTVAGVGMEKLEDTLSYNIAQAVHEKSGKTVAWRTACGNSATMAQIRDYLVPHIEDRDFTHIVISAGTNDMKNFHAVGAFKRSFGTLIYALRARFPDAEVLWSPITDMEKLPALPKGLARVLRYRAELINAKGKQLCQERGATYTEPVPVLLGNEGFARDLFHPGPAGYRIWGEHLAGYIVKSEAG